jgi:anti-anti-sigma factor
LRGSREVKDNYQIIRLVGQLDAFSEPALTKVNSELLAQGPKHFVFDLTKIEFIDSSGLGALVKLDKESKSQDGSLLIVPSNRVKQTVKMIKLDKFLNLQPDLESAIATLGE